MSSKFGWEKGDIEIVKQPVKKAKSYAEAARLLAIVERAGARHNASDNTLIQQAHDILCDLGAACKHDEDEMGILTAEDLRRYAPFPMLKAAVDALILRHPGHANQKTHGNRFGSGQAKESLRRLKDDKGAREKYKESHRGKTAARRQEFSKDIDTAGKVNALRDRQSLLQRQVDTENLKPKYRKEKQAEMKKIQGEIDALKVSRVRPGSFIKARGTSLTGIVTGKGTIKYGKEDVPVFKVRTPKGTTVIPFSETDLIVP